MKKLILIAILLTNQVLACEFSTHSNKAKWEISPTIKFDLEFSQDQALVNLAYRAVDMINNELQDIQLQVEFTTEDYHSLSTHLAQGGTVESYAQYRIDLTNNNQGSILVQMDESFTGFGGTFGNNIGFVSLKTSEFLGLITGGTSISGNTRIEEFGDDYVMQNVLMHEIMHALNIRHQIEPIEGSSPIAGRTRPVMHYLVNRQNYGITETDRQALQVLYGIPCDKHRVELRFNNTNSLAVTFLPVRPKVKQLIRRNWRRFRGLAYETRVNNNAVTVGVFDDIATAYLNEGTYLVMVRGIAGHDPSSAFKPDIEGGTPSQDGVRYLRCVRGSCALTGLKGANRFVVREERSEVIE